MQNNVLDKGHEAEASIRPYVEEVIGQPLYPVTVTNGGKESASLDGMTMDEEIGWEHKQWNEALAEAVRNNVLPEEHYPQVQQQLMMGLKAVIFTVSNGTPEKCVSMTVYPEQEWFERIANGWAQFEADLANHVPVEIIERPKAEVTIELPALFIQAQGSITDSNMVAYGEALADRLKAVRAIELITDQDFSNAKEAAKLLRDQCKKLELTKEAMLAQTVSIGEASRMMDAWYEDLRLTALDLEKKVEREDLNKKREMIEKAGAEFTDHINLKSKEIEPIRLVVNRPDFAVSIKGKSKYSSMHEALNVAVANGKIEADTITKDIRAKLDWFDDESAEYKFLFADLQQIIYKPMDDFKLVVTSRIRTHKEDIAEKQRKEIEQQQAQSQQVQETQVTKEPAKPIRKLDGGAGGVSRPGVKEIIDTVAMSYRVTSDVALGWLVATDFKAAQTVKKAA